MGVTESFVVPTQIRLGASLHSPSVELTHATIHRSTTALDAVTIYGHSGSRSPLVNWACLELGIPFSMGNLQANPHPFGQLPCLADDSGVTVFESGAILQYLQQNYSPSETLSKAEQAAITSWIVWANASLDPICFLETPDGKVYDTGLRKPNRRMKRLEEILKSNQRKEDGLYYLVPTAGFTVADVAVTAYLLYVVQFFPDAVEAIERNTPIVSAYMRQCAARPAYGEAFGERVQSFVLDKLEPRKKIFGVL